MIKKLCYILLCSLLLTGCWKDIVNIADNPNKDFLNIVDNFDHSQSYDLILNYTHIDKSEINSVIKCVDGNFVISTTNDKTNNITYKKKDNIIEKQMIDDNTYAFIHNQISENEIPDYIKLDYIKKYLIKIDELHSYANQINHDEKTDEYTYGNNKYILKNGELSKICGTVTFDSKEWNYELLINNSYLKSIDLNDESIQ